MLSFEIIKIIGGILFLYLTWRNLADDYKEERLISYSWLAMLAFLAGGRIIFGILHWGIWNDNLGDWLAFWIKPGFNLVGGIMGMLLVSGWYVTASGWKIWPFMEGMTEIIYLFLGFIAASNLAGGDFSLNLLAYLIIAVVGYVLAGILKNKYRSFVWYKSGKKGFVFFFVNFIVGMLLTVNSVYFGHGWLVTGLMGLMSLISLVGLFILGEVFNNLMVSVKRRNNGKNN